MLRRKTRGSYGKIQESYGIETDSMQGTLCNRVRTVRNCVNDLFHGFSMYLVPLLKLASKARLGYSS
jgi:hypothetical protein